MNSEVDWKEVHDLLESLYDVTDRLEEVFPGRKFTLDGHLVGSIGEVLAAYMFDLDLQTASNKGHDAKTRDGKKEVEIKFTQGESIGIRARPQHLLVLQRRKGESVSVVFNGPGELAWQNVGQPQKNGQCPISVKKLRVLDEGIQSIDRIEQSHEAPI